MAVSVGMSDRGSDASSASAGRGQQQVTVLRVRGRQGRDSALRAAATLQTVPGVRRVLLDEAGHSLVVRGTAKPSDLRRALNRAKIPSAVVSRANSRRGGAFLDQTALAFLILIAQIVLAVEDFGIRGPLHPAIQAGASAFVVLVLGAPLLRAAAAWLGRLALSTDLALSLGAGAAWLAGALSILRLQEAGQPYFLLATLITACGLLAHTANRVSRAASSARLQGILQLMPDQAMVETRDGVVERPTATLKRGQVVIVEHGTRFPSDGEILAGNGLVDESTICGVERPYRCGPGDAVLAGTVNRGDARRVRITARPRDASVTLLAHVAAGTDAPRAPWQSRLERGMVWAYLAVIVLAGLAVLAGWLTGREPVAAVETGLLILAAGAPASLALAAPVSHSVAMMMLRRWGIWVREPLEIEQADATSLLVVGAAGVVTEGVRRVLRVTAAGGGDEHRLLAVADAALLGSSYRWARQVHAAAVRHNVAERVLEAREQQCDDGVIAAVRDGQRSLRVTLGSAAFLERQGIVLNPNFIVVELPGEPAAEPVFVAIDGHAAGAIWLTDPIRQTARGTIRNLRSSGIETCLMGNAGERSLAQIAGTVETDSFVIAENSDQQVAEIEAMRASGHRVAMVGHPVRDAAGLAAADLSIGFGALNTPAAARPSFLIRDESVLLLATCFAAARTMRRRLRQSIAVAAVPIVIAVALAAANRLDVWVALMLVGLGVAVVLANSLRLMGWRPRFVAGSR